MTFRNSSLVIWVAAWQKFDGAKEQGKTLCPPYSGSSH